MNLTNQPSSQIDREYSSLGQGLDNLRESGLTNKDETLNSLRFSDSSHNLLSLTAKAATSIKRSLSIRPKIIQVSQNSSSTYNGDLNGPQKNTLLNESMSSLPSTRRYFPKLQDSSKDSSYTNLRTLRSQKSSEITEEDMDLSSRRPIFNVAMPNKISTSQHNRDTPHKRESIRETRTVCDNTCNLIQTQWTDIQEELEIDHIEGIPATVNDPTNLREIKSHYNGRSNFLNYEVPVNEENKEHIEHNIPNTNNLTTTIEQARTISINPIEETNSNEITVPVVIQPQAHRGETDPSLRRFYEPEVRIYLSKAIGFFLALSLVCLFLVLATYSILSYEAFAGIIWSLLLYLIGIDVFWKRKVLNELWVNKDDAMQVFDLLNLGLAVTFVYFKLRTVLPISSLACLPFLLTASIQLFSKDACEHITWNTITRCLYGFLSLVISLKIDDFIEWSWHTIFSVPWLYFGIKSLCCFKYAFSLMKVIVLYRSQRNDRDEGMRDNWFKVVGCFWYFMYNGINLIGGMLLLGIAQADEPEKSFELLKAFGYVGIIVSIFLLLYTIVKKKDLKQFIITFGLIESRLASFEQKQKQKRRASLRAEYRTAYFMMASSTYFIPLEQSFSVKSKENIQKIKTKVNQLVSKKVKAQYSSIAGSIIDILDLRQYKESLSKQVCKIQKIKNIIKRNKLHKGLNSTMPNPSKEKQEILKGSNLVSSLKRGFSTNDLDDVKKLNVISSENKEEESLCYLCYTHYPNIIIASCGHGGICYNCASVAIKKKDECVECRKKVEGIYRIDSKLKFLDIVKVNEFNRVVITGNLE